MGEDGVLALSDHKLPPQTQSRAFPVHARSAIEEGVHHGILGAVFVGHGTRSMARWSDTIVRGSIWARTTRKLVRRRSQDYPIGSVQKVCSSMNSPELVLQEFFLDGGLERRAVSLLDAVEGDGVWSLLWDSFQVDEKVSVAIGAQQLARLREMFPDKMPTVDPKRYLYELSLRCGSAALADGYVLKRRSEMDGKDLSVFMMTSPLSGGAWSDFFPDDSFGSYEAIFVPRPLDEVLARAYGVSGDESSDSFYELYPYLLAHKKYYLERWGLDLSRAVKA